MVEDGSRAVWARRFVDRVAIQRPRPDEPYARLTDEQLAAMVEPARTLARIGRDLHDALGCCSWLQLTDQSGQDIR